MDQANDWQEHFCDCCGMVQVNNLDVVCELAAMLHRWSVCLAIACDCTVVAVDFWSANDLMEMDDCDAVVVLVNSVNVAQETHPVWVVVIEIIGEAEVTVISVYLVDRAINDEMVVVIVMKYGEPTKLAPIEFRAEILVLATNISVN